jgi:hypothetical protein
MRVLATTLATPATPLYRALFSLSPEVKIWSPTVNAHRPARLYLLPRTSTRKAVRSYCDWAALNLVLGGYFMRYQLVITAAAAVAICVGGCAPTPESISPAYISEVPYQSFTCEQLGEEQVRLNQALATASGQQSTARTNDVVGYIFIGLPVGSMSGQSIAPQIAVYKGQLEAVHKASIRKSCIQLTPPAVQPDIQAQKPVSTSERR